jgi:hypothetical protein
VVPQALLILVDDHGAACCGGCGEESLQLLNVLRGPFGV